MDMDAYLYPHPRLCGSRSFLGGRRGASGGRPRFTALFPSLAQTPTAPPTTTTTPPLIQLCGVKETRATLKRLHLTCSEFNFYSIFEMIPRKVGAGF